jgi:GAF domain-containing protein/HAMP domain-containing protein
MFKDRYAALSKIEQRVLWSTLVLSAIIAVFAASVFDELLAAPNLQVAWVYFMPSVVSSIALFGALLILYGRKEWAAWVLLIGSSIALLVVVSQAESYGLPSAFVLFAITFLVSTDLLKGRSAQTALIVGLVCAILIVILDTVWNLPRVPVPAEDVLAGEIISVLLGAVLAVVVFTQYTNLTFRSKVIVMFVILAISAVGAVSVAISVNARSQLTRQVGSEIRYKADRIALDIRDNLTTQVHLLQVEAQNLLASVTAANAVYLGDETPEQVVESLKALDQEWTGSDENGPLAARILNNSTADRLREFQTISPKHVELFITDQYGANIAATDRTTDFYQADEDWWQAAFNGGRGAVYIGQPEYDQSSQTFAISIVVPVLSGDRAVGVLRSTWDVTDLLSLLQTERFGNSGVAEMRLGKDRILGNTELSAAELSSLRVMEDQFEVMIYRGKESLVSEVPLPVTEMSDPAQAAISQLGWSVIVHQDSSEAFALIANQTKTSTLLALIVSVLAGVLGYFVAQWIVAPVVQLTNTTGLIAHGDLTQRSGITTKDEIGTLASAINTMTSRLQDTLGGLERRVAERTADLELARSLSERRAAELQSISDISRLISSEQRLEVLFGLITQLVSEKFDFYHVGIFLVDSTGQFAVLQAANSEGGKQMLAHGHRLEVGRTGIVGNVAKTGEASIALDVGADARYFNNPDLPETHSEMALPLRVHGKTIGVIDVQSKQPGAFTITDAQTLSILADQIAIAIDNARLFGQNKQALDELQSLYNQYLRQEWKTFVQNRQNIGYVQSMISGKPLEAPVVSDEIQRALVDGQVVVLGADDRSLPTIAVPVKLRDQIIGVLHIKAPSPNRRWNQDEINMAQAISDRLALALDNARLLFASQRQTAKEQKIGEVTAKIGASMNMRNVLQTAVEELGRALPGSEVLIQFQSNGKQE